MKELKDHFYPTQYIVRVENQMQGRHRKQAEIFLDLTASKLESIKHSGLLSGVPSLFRHPHAAKFKPCSADGRGYTIRESRLRFAASFILNQLTIAGFFLRLTNLFPQAWLGKLTPLKIQLLIKIGSRIIRLKAIGSLNSFFLRLYLR